jgi:hypothetical protein
MGDVEIDPFDPAHALYITGQGVWSTDDLTAADTGGPTHWTFDDAGLEETVALDLASPPVMPPDGALLLTGVGDIAGFRHDDLDASPPNGMFANPVFGNTSSIDFAEGMPSLVARVGTSSNGGARGAYSMDGGKSWTPFAGTPMVSGTNAQAASQGSIAVAADGSTFVWAPVAQRNNITVTPSYSQDMGRTWKAVTGINAGAKVAADRVNASKLYANSGNRMLVSSDGGKTFTPSSLPTGMMPVNVRPRPVPGVEGDVWVATGAGVLRSQDSGATYVPVARVNNATAVGFGAPNPAQANPYPAVYVAGSVADSSGAYNWGTYRSDDAGATWQRIDDAQHQFGSINCLTGDPRTFGRVYLGTGGRGIIYGDPR